MKSKKIILAKILGKYLLSLLLSFQFCTLYAQEIDQNKVKEIIAYNSILEGQNMASLIINGDISLLSKHIDPISIARLNQDQLRVLRNTIFAQFGYTFKSEDLKKHFSQFNWYSPKSNNVDSQLSSLDLINIKRIHKFENSAINSETIISMNDLVGAWHIMAHVADSFHEVYQFYHDGRFTYNYSQARDLPTFLSFSGRYKTKGNVLFLNAESRKIVVHTDDIKDTVCCGIFWTDYKPGTELFSRQFHFPISRIKTAGELDIYHKEGWVNWVDKSKLTIEVGGTIYFKYSDNPDDYS